MVRSLLCVNGVVLVVMLLNASSLQAGLLAFGEASLLLELACLASLFALCGLRRLVRSIPPWGQRLACALVPGTITALIIHYLLSDDLMLTNLSRVSVPEGFVCSALFGISRQHYF